jgi:hypothetical protein
MTTYKTFIHGSDGKGGKTHWVAKTYHTLSTGQIVDILTSPDPLCSNRNKGTGRIFTTYNQPQEITCKRCQKLNPISQFGSTPIEL